MFDKRTVEAYRSMTAPPELKAKVLAQAKSEKTVPFKIQKATSRMIRRISAAAACLVLALGVWAATRETGGRWQADISAVVISETAEQGLIRMAAEEPVTVKLEISRAAELACDEGELLVQEQENITPASRGQNCRAAENALVLWQIPAADTTKTYTMILSDEADTVTLTLSYKTAEDCWTVSFAE